MAVQWLGLCAPTAGDAGSIPGRGTKIPRALFWGTARTNTRKHKQEFSQEPLPEPLASQVCR